MIRIVIADDHTMVREGLKQVLSAASDLALIGEARDGTEVMQRVRELDFEVLLLDLSTPDLSLSVIKLLGAGEYVVELPGTTVAGHFGLAVKDYTHSTAPNRRFPDLITQRLLKAAMAGRSPSYQNAELAALAKHCTEAEDAARKVERQVTKSAAAMLLESRIGDRFDAIVTGAADKGTWVRLLHPPIEGRLVSGFEGMDIGHRLRVQLVRTVVQRGYIDFKRVA